MWLQLSELADAWKTKRVLVVGDILVDLDIHTRFIRDSNEFAGKIYREEGRIQYPGGAANVAQICASLGAQVTLMGPLGIDSAGHWLRRWCRENDSFHYVGYLGAPHWQQTTTKTRLFQDGQFLCRIDRDVENEFPSDQLNRHLHPDRLPYDALLLSDYQKGCFPSAESVKELVRTFKERSPNGIVGLNPKPSCCPASPCGLDLITMNDQEYCSLPHRDHTYFDDGPYLAHRLGVEMLLHTEGERGLHLYHSGGKIITSLVGKVVDPDVVGCGDAVFAAAVLARTVTSDCSRIAAVASAAGTVKAGKRGTVAVTPAEIATLLSLEI